MKRRVNTIFLLLGVIIHLGCLQTYGKSAPKPAIKVAEQLVDYLNRQLPGAQFKTDIEKCSVKEVALNRYLVIFKDCTFTTDLTAATKAINKIFPSEIAYDSSLDTASIKEAHIYFSPPKDEKAGNARDKEKSEIITRYIHAVVLKGLQIRRDIPAHKQKKELEVCKGYKVTGYYASVEEMNFGEDEEAHSTSKGIFHYPMVIAGIVGRLPGVSDSSIKNLKIGLTGITKGKDKIAFELEIEKITGNNVGIEDPYIYTYIFVPGTQPPNLEKSAERGMAIVDTKYELGKVHLSLEKNGSKWGRGSMEKASFSMFVKPGENGEFFKIGYSTGIKNMEFSLPGVENIQLLSDLKAFHFLFSVDRIPPSSILAMVEMIKLVYQSRDVIDDDLFQQISYQGLKFIMEIGSSTLPVTFRISPFEHYFGKMRVEALIQLHGLMGRPGLKFKVDLFKLEEILKKISEVDLFSRPFLQEITAYLNTVTVKKANGDASLTIELKADQPGKIFLNGLPYDKKQGIFKFLQGQNLAPGLKK